MPITVGLDNQFLFWGIVTWVIKKVWPEAASIQPSVHL